MNIRINKWYSGDFIFEWFFSDAVTASGCTNHIVPDGILREIITVNWSGCDKSVKNATKLGIYSNGLHYKWIFNNKE